MKRVILVVLDSVGVGAAADAKNFGDEGANTVGNIAKWCHKNNHPFNLPNLSRWGLGKILPNTYGLMSLSDIIASHTRMVEVSPGKDTTTGHWEMAGTELKKQFPVYSSGFSNELLEDWCQKNKLPGWLFNQAGSGTTVIEQWGEEHIQSGKPIVYTSADSVFQVAASEEHFGLERLYEICKSARKLVDPLGVGRVIARPFIGNSPTDFKRTENRRDFSTPPPAPNLLDILRSEGAFVAGVGKIEDIFAHRSVNLVDHTGNNASSLDATCKMMEETRGQKGLIFTNLIDFDQLHGHRRNPKTYADALMEFDKYLPKLEALCEPDDLMILTADHGNDPTHTGTDHTREEVPLLYWSPHSKFRVHTEEKCRSFATVARLTLDALGMEKNLPDLPDAARTTALFSKTGLS